jgi:hypothetical protein
LYNTFGIGGFNEYRGTHKDILKQHFQQQLRNPKKGYHAFAEKNISVTMSSTEAELLTLSTTTKEVLW